MSRGRLTQAEATLEERLDAAEAAVSRLLDEILEVIPVLAGKRKEVINHRRSITALQRELDKMPRQTVPEAPRAEPLGRTVQNGGLTRGVGGGASPPPRRFKDRDEALAAAKAKVGHPGPRSRKRLGRGGK